MAFVVTLFGLFIIGLGIYALISPERILALVARAQSQRGLYLIACIRLLLGAALLMAAGASRAPLYLQILGGVSLVSGLATPLFGVRGAEAVLSWWRRRPSWVVRVWSLVVILFGASLVWAVLPLERATYEISQTFFSLVPSCGR